LSATPPKEARGAGARLVLKRLRDTPADMVTLDLTVDEVDELSEYPWIRVIRLARKLGPRRGETA
jgi:hypothetical protein